MVRVRHAGRRVRAGRVRARRGRSVDAEGGAVAVEFALLFPLLFFLLFGILIFGWRIWEHQAGQSAAGDAVRLASLGIDDLDDYRQNVICLGQHDGLGAGNLTTIKIDFFTADMQPTDQATSDGYVETSLTYRSTLGAFPMITSEDGTFVSSAIGRVEQVGTVGTEQSISTSGEQC